MGSFARRVLAAVAIVAVALLFGGVLFYLLQGVLIIFAGILFGVFLFNLADRTSSVTGLSFKSAFSIVVSGLLLLTVCSAVLMGSQIAGQANQFAQEFTKSVDQVQTRLEQQGIIQWLNSREVKQMIEPQQVAATARNTVTGILWILGSIVLILFLGFYFALQSDTYRRGLVKLVSPEWRPRVEEVLGLISQKLWWWILGRLVGMAVIGVTSTIGLWLLGVPLPLPLGVIAGLLNFIPNLGPLIALLPAVLIASQQGMSTILYVIALYTFLQFVESYFITPLIDQQQVSLPPGLILAAQLLMGMIGGVFGLLLATPLTVTITVLVREFYVKEVLKESM